MSVRCPQTNLQIRIIKKKSLRGRKDFQCRYVYQYQNLLYCHQLDKRYQSHINDPHRQLIFGEMCIKIKSDAWGQLGKEVPLYFFLID